MKAKKLKDLVLKLIKREPGLVFDLIEDDWTPPPQPPQPTPTNIPSWCRCLNCTEMPTELERKCCGCKPENCVSQGDVSSFENGIYFADITILLTFYTACINIQCNQE